MTTLMTPGGMPARSASSATAVADSGVNSAGFSTAVQPAARAGAIWGRRTECQPHIRVNESGWEQAFPLFEKASKVVRGSQHDLHDDSPFS